MTDAIAAINRLPVQSFTTEATQLINDVKISLLNATLLNHVPTVLQNSVLFQAQTMAEADFAKYLLLLLNPADVVDPDQDMIDALTLSAKVTLIALRDRGVLDNQMSLSAILEALS